MFKLFLVLFTSICFFSFLPIQNANSNKDLSVLIGVWQIDMSPQDKTNKNFAKMEIHSVDNNMLQGYFYRAAVKIREGRINVQSGVIYAALVSGDNSGEYNTAFYYKDGILYGTTHSLDRDFLSVWTATKIK